MVVNAIAAIGQALLALVAGGIAGHYADPALASVVTGAIGLFVGTIAAYAVANFSLLVLAPFALGKRASEETPPPEDENDYTGFVWWAGVTVVMLAIVAAAAITAIVIATSSDVAELGPTLGYFLLASLPVALLTVRARRIVA